MGQVPAPIFRIWGQSSLPIWVLGTIEFIWAGWIPIKPHHKIIPPQNIFFRSTFRHRKAPEPKCRPKIFPKTDLGNFSRSLQKVRTANPSETLSRSPPSKLQTEPRGENVFFIFQRTKRPSEMLSRTLPSKLQTEPRGEKRIFYFPTNKTMVFLAC